MRFLINAARSEMIFLITALGAVTLWRLCKDGSFAGLLRSRDKSLSPARIQLLMVTVLTAMHYLLSTIHDPSHLPTVPLNLVAVLGGSQSLYLGAKAWDFRVKDKRQEKQ
jgi:hypothetical protein